MNDPTIRLKCEISSLQTELVCVKQEKQKLYDTIIFLSNILSGFAQSNQPTTWNKHHQGLTTIESVTGSPTTESSADFQKSLPSHYSVLDSAHVVQPPDNIFKQDSETPNLIDLTGSSSEIHHAPGDHVESADARSAKASFTTNSTEALTDSTTEQEHKLKEKPPVLDLQFKGLRTLHDGPERTSGVESSFGSRSSLRAPSFDEIYGQTDRGGATIHDSGDATKIIEPVAVTERTSMVLNAKSQYPSKHFGQTNLHRFVPRRSAATYESSSSQSNDFSHLPLSLFLGIRYELGNEEVLNRDRVMLLNLPNDISLSSILSKIRGGTVVSCELLDTGFAYGGPSAMIRFSKYGEAMFCVDQAATKPLVFDKQTAVVQLIPTPSYPLAPEVSKDISDHGHTRCLRIARFSHIKGAGSFKQYTNPQFIEYQATNTYGDWEVRFTSLQRASALWAAAQSMGFTRYGGGFMPDPCAVNEPLDGEDGKEKKDVQAMPMAPLKWKL